MSSVGDKMATEPVSVAMDTVSGTPTVIPVVLKKIMEIPPPNLLEGEDGECRRAQPAVGGSCIAEWLTNAP